MVWLGCSNCVRNSVGQATGILEPVGTRTVTGITVGLPLANWYANSRVFLSLPGHQAPGTFGLEIPETANITGSPSSTCPMQTSMAPLGTARTFSPSYRTLFRTEASAPVSTYVKSKPEPNLALVCSHHLLLLYRLIRPNLKDPLH